MMIVVIGKILLGLGLMFTGVQMLSFVLKQVGSRQFRMLATRFVSSRVRALAFGLGSGAVMQSTSAALVILASLISAGMMLGFIAQSSTAVALVAIGLAREGILTSPQAFLFMYGAAIGSTICKVMIGQRFRGTSRQLVRFVNIFNVFGASVFILLYYIEVYWHVPLVMALLNSFLPDLDDQAAWVFLLFNLTSAIFFITINGPLTRWLARSLPPSEEEGLSHPRYLSEFQPEDPDTGLALIRLEQARELEQIAAFVATAREDYWGTDLSSRYVAFKSLASEVAASTATVAAMKMQPHTAKNQAYFQTRQALLDQLADSTASGVKIILQASTYPSLKELAGACRESIDFLLTSLPPISRKQTIRSRSGYSRTSVPAMVRRWNNCARHIWTATNSLRQMTRDACWS